MNHHVSDWIIHERDKQDAKWGANRKLHPLEWNVILGEEVGEVARAILEGGLDCEDVEHRMRLREELVQVAAVAVAWLEALYRLETRT